VVVVDQDQIPLAGALLLLENLLDEVNCLRHQEEKLEN
jgi:hypothetical protein